MSAVTDVRPEAAAVPGDRWRVRARVEGTVQGVGFRPFVYRLAGESGLDGFVLNDTRGVLIEVEGPRAEVERFLARIAPERPPLAEVERIGREELPALGGRPGFAIRESPRGGVADAPVTADSAICQECRQELFDPADRRFRYPFVNCTNCGPRFTIVRGIPYDRPLTTMATFTMCPACQAEYDDPGDRRFHAQPNACPACGPAVRLLDARGEPAPLAGAADPVAAAAAALLAGRIVAIKGIGGYHLACRADDETAVATLRARKHREDKPFALIAASAEAAAEVVALGEQERALLGGPERPIVLARRREGPGAARRVAASVAPGSPELGVMLPYSPLHDLLISDVVRGAADPGVLLVLTSGNVSEEPIAYHDDDALARLSGIADGFLTHDRAIATRTDDSVARVLATPGGPRLTFLRRSRGYVPASLALPLSAPDLLACGAELKSTFCVAKGRRAWVSHHIGDLRNYETLRSFTDGVAHFERLFAVAPTIVVHDLHPDYLSTRYALERDGVEPIAVQHHHAHLAACLAEHGVDGRAVGAIFDGTGYGADGTVWGGELLFGDCESFARVGSLPPVPMPGGAQAIREPWRMACAWLDAACEGDPPLPGPLAGQIPATTWDQMLALSRSGLTPVRTSSAGRLFDAVAAICGVRAAVRYEGQAAIELEAACDPLERSAYPIVALDPREAIRMVLADGRRGVPLGVIAARFHNGMAAAVVEACARAASERDTEIAVLSGGVFQNRRLLEAAAAGLAAAGLRVLTPSRLPANDGGISYGQAAVATRLVAARG